ncbi:hypothetical protein G7Y89_g14208 [Cudoniella acicularis]|uniref:Uncharacterized protein n=1 Tax=Cudoniella acicularis TaxID=354080 RepID=A0A8H4R3X5_9HELO|nr:hypothetical protein G7Y89_g14208 [Cudoniella acicularis]
MRFSLALIAYVAMLLDFGVNVGVNAIPTPESVKTEAGLHQLGARADGINLITRYLKTNNKGYGTNPYPAAPDSTKAGNTVEIKDTRYKAIHGPYVAVPNEGTLKVEAKAGTSKVNSDHVFEIQTLSRFMKLHVLVKPLNGFFLANHQAKFFESGSAAERAADPNYKNSVYHGSLYQHLIKQLGSIDHLDRLALLDTPTNSVKGNLWGMKALGLPTDPLQAAYQIERLNNYMVSEKDAWCAAATGMIKELNEFREARKSPAQTTLTHRPAPPHTKRTSPKKPDPKTPRPQRAAVFGVNYALTPVTGVASPLESNDEDYNEKPPPQANGDLNRGGLTGDYAIPIDLDYNDDFVEFLNAEVKTAGANLKKEFTAVQVKLSAADRPKFKDFSVTFVKALLDCEAMKDHKAVEPVDEPSSDEDSGNESPTEEANKRKQAAAAKKKQQEEEEAAKKKGEPSDTKGKGKEPQTGEGSETAEEKKKKLEAAKEAAKKKGKPPPTPVKKPAKPTKPKPKDDPKKD